MTPGVDNTLSIKNEEIQRDLFEKALSTADKTTIDDSDDILDKSREIVGDAFAQFKEQMLKEVDDPLYRQFTEMVISGAEYSKFYNFNHLLGDVEKILIKNRDGEKIENRKAPDDWMVC